MDWNDGPGTVSAVVAVLAMLGGFIAFVRSIRASRDASAAAQRAEAAEERANEARDRAANALVRATELAEAAAVRDDEDWFVEWRLNWEPRPNLLTLTNAGKDPARIPSVVVTGKENLHLTQSWDTEVPVHGSIAVELPEIGERRYRYVTEGDTQTRNLRDAQAAGIFTAPDEFFDELKVVVRWRTGQGRIQEQVYAHLVA